jgi:hypothetical protein
MIRLELFYTRASRAKTMLLMGTVAGSMLVSPMLSQSPAQAPPPASAFAPVAKPAVPGAPRRYQPDRFAGRAGKYYPLIWGIDSLTLKSVESGDLIRFSYRVLDPNKAGILNDKKVEAYLDSPAAHSRLVIPSLEKVGQLRQGNTPRTGTSYWMAFSNPRRTVKRGDHVNVVIGTFHAEGLVVE